MEGDTSLNPGVDQTLTTTDASSASSFSRLQRESGAELIRPRLGKLILRL